jgi:hypothetical protein
LVFVCCNIVGFLFLFLFLFSFCTVNFTITIFSSLFLPPSLSFLLLCYTHCFPSQLLFLPLLIHSLPLPSPPPYILHQPVTRLPSLLYTHHLLTNLLCQLYTTPTPCNPWHKHPAVQQKYTQTHPRATKPRSPYTTSSTHPPHFPPLLLVPPKLIN